MTLNVNEEDLTIMNIQFSTLKEFKAVLYAISSNMYEGYEPTEKDILELKNYISEKADYT